MVFARTLLHCGLNAGAVNSILSKNPTYYEGILA